MEKSVKVQIEKISNGFLFTESLNDVEGKKTFNQHKSDLFDHLKNNEAIGGLLEDDEDILLLEIIRHDFAMIKEQKTNKEMLEEIVQREKFDPFPKKNVDEKELRLSVTKANAYSAERLMSIDFDELDKKLPLSMVRKAEICGRNYGVIFGFFSRSKKNGKPNYSFVDTRIYMTILAKYYESVLGIRTSKRDEIEKLTEGIQEQISALEEIFNKKCLVPSASLQPIIFKLKMLLSPNA